MAVAFDLSLDESLQFCTSMTFLDYESQPIISNFTFQPPVSRHVLYETVFMEFEGGIVRTLTFSTPMIARSFLANMESLEREVTLELGLQLR